MRPINAFLNDVSLRGVDSRILIRGISEQTPQAELIYGDNPGRMGQRLLSRRRVNRRVSITFAIRELRDLAARSAVVDAVNGWAQDGVLKISTRPGRQLRVLCAGRAAIQSPRDYTEEFRVDFDAAACPYWEDTVPEVLALSGSSGSGKILNLGSAEAEPAVTVTPAGGTLNTLGLSLGNTAFAFSGLAVPAGTALRMAYDDRGYLRITAGSASKTGCRAPESSDDLIAQPGANAFSFTADTNCTVNIEVRGRWL